MSVQAMAIRDSLRDVIFDLNIEGKSGKEKIRNKLGTEGETRAKN